MIKNISITSDIKHIKKQIMTFDTFSTSIGADGYLSYSWDFDEYAWNADLIQEEIEKVMSSLEHGHYFEQCYTGSVPVGEKISKFF